MKIIPRFVLLILCVGLLVSCQFERSLDSTNNTEYTANNQNEHTDKENKNEFAYPNDVQAVQHSSLNENMITDNEYPVDSPTGNGDENESVETVRLMLLGDTMMDGNMAKAMDTNGNDYPLQEFMPLLQEADLIVANLETAVGTSGILADKSFAFQTDPQRFELFEPLRDKIVFTLANNHGMDAPLDETMNNLDTLGYSYVGVGNNIDDAFEPFVTQVNGISIAIIGASRVIPTVEWAAGEGKPGMASAYVDEPLLSTVEYVQEMVDYVLVYVHWGEERSETLNDVQIELEKKLKDRGANFIIGSHPHVLQEIRWASHDQLTAFSLGNFVFTTSYHEQSNESIVLEINFSAQRIKNVQVHPAHIQFGRVRHVQEKDDSVRNAIFKRLDRLSPSITVGEDGTINQKTEDSVAE